MGVEPIETMLTLTTSDGAVYMAFSPALSSTQYGRLLSISTRAHSADALRDAVVIWAAMEGLQYAFDDMQRASWG